jgi:general secretion pathway protein J
MRARGFTLIEVVVALAIVAGVGAMALGLSVRLEREGRALQASMSSTAQVRALFRFVQHDLDAMVMRPVLDRMPLHGRASRYGGHDYDALSIVRRARDDGRLPFHQVSYRSRRHDDGSLSVWRSIHGLTARPEHSEPLQLLTAAAGFRVRYLNAEGNWVKQWDAATGGGLLPRAIRLEVELRSGALWHTVFAVPGGDAARGRAAYAAASPP